MMKYDPGKETMSEERTGGETGEACLSSERGKTETKEERMTGERKTAGHGVLVDVALAFLFLGVLIPVVERIFFLGFVVFNWGLYMAAYVVVFCFLGWRYSFRTVATANLRTSFDVWPVSIGAVYPAILLFWFWAGGYKNIPPDYAGFAASGVLGKLWFSANGFVIGPIVEELLFRGFFYSMLRERYGILWATMLSSILFALAHVFLPRGFWRFMPMFLHGLVCAWAYQKSRSIWGSIIAHAMNNGVFVFIYYFAWYGLLPR